MAKKQEKEFPWLIMVAAIALGVLLSATYAWFTVGRTASANPVEIVAEAGANLQIKAGRISDPGADGFANVASFDPIPATYFGKDITGNGIDFFGYTTNKGANGIPYEFGPAIAGVDFIAQDFTFRSNANLNIYLASESSVDDKENKGTLSPAVRLAFYEWDGSKYNFKFVWAPKTSQTANNLTYCKNGCTIPSSYSGIVGNGLLPSVNDAIISGESGKVATLTVTKDAAGNNQFGVRSIQVKIWIEGTDPAAINESLVNNQATWITKLEFIASDI